MSGKTLVVIIILALVVLWCGTQQYFLTKSYKESALRAIEVIKKSQDKYNTLDSRHNALRILYSSLAHKKDGFQSFGFFAFMEDGQEAHITVNHKGRELTIAEQSAVDKALTIALKNVTGMKNWEKFPGDSE